MMEFLHETVFFAIYYNLASVCKGAIHPLTSTELFSIL